MIIVRIRLHFLTQCQEQQRNESAHANRIKDILRGAPSPANAGTNDTPPLSSTCLANASDSAVESVQTS